jgi:hypothetical protein
MKLPVRHIDIDTLPENEIPLNLKKEKVGKLGKARTHKHKHTRIEKKSS